MDGCYHLAWAASSSMSPRQRAGDVLINKYIHKYMYAYIYIYIFIFIRLSSPRVGSELVNNSQTGSTRRKYIDL